MVAEDHARLRAQRLRRREALLFEGWLQELERVGQRQADVDREPRAAGRPRQRLQPVDEPLHPLDLAGRDPPELLQEAPVVTPPRQELHERLDGHQRILDLVGDARRQRLEVGEPLGAPPLDLELLQGGEVAEHHDRPQHGTARVTHGRRRADDRPAGAAVGRRQVDVRLGARLAILDGGAQRVTEAGRQHVDAGVLGVLGRQPREVLGRPVEHRDLPPGVDGHHPALQGGHDVLQVLVGDDDRRVELRVLDGDSGLIGQRHQEVQVLLIERIARQLRPHGDHRDQRVLREHRQQQRPVRLGELLAQRDRRRIPLARHLVGDDRLLGRLQGGDHLAGRLRRRREVLHVLRLLGDGAPEDTVLA